ANLNDEPAKEPHAAASQKMTAQHLDGLGIVDEDIPEPLGGAHRDARAISDRVAKALTNQLYSLVDLPTEQLITQRDQKFRKMGVVVGGLVPA
nr:acetyl-CoA carboxylase carboxyl transferase subunit alpha [Nitrospira sp.]